MEQIKFEIKNMELCLGIGEKPMPNIARELRCDKRIKELWKKHSYVNVRYTMTKFYDNRGMDSHTNSFADVSVSVELTRDTL